jgi:hypothetical protein
VLFTASHDSVLKFTSGYPLLKNKEDKLALSKKKFPPEIYSLINKNSSYRKNLFHRFKSEGNRISC